MGVNELLSKYLATPDDLLDVFPHNQTGPGRVVQRVKVDDRGVIRRSRRRIRFFSAILPK